MSNIPIGVKPSLKNVKPKISSTIRGIFATSIPYEIRNPTGDYSPYFGQYEGQRKEGFDTNSCWSYAGNECVEDTLEFLWKTGQFSKETMDWFQANGYIDEDGDFYLSRRFIPTLSGVKDNGNDEDEFWRLTKLYGAIPNKLLPYNGENRDAYFDLTKITPAMYALGVEFLKRVNVERQEIGKRFFRKDLKLLQSALFQSELQIGIPVPQDGSWNQTKVKWNGQTQAAHSVALYKVDEKADYDYPYFIYDQYEPKLKQLSRDYFITICTQGVLTPKPQVVVNPVSQLTLGAKIWYAIFEWFQRFPTWSSPSSTN